MKKNDQILIVPAFEKGRGGGHLTRCVSLVQDLRAAGREAVIYLPDTGNFAAKCESGIVKSQTENLLKSMGFNKDWLFKNEKSFETIDFIIMDRFQTPQDEINFWKRIAPVIGIDEGGLYRDNFDFLIDALVPENFIKPAANITSPALLFRNNNPECAEKKNDIPKILISFGQEDSAGLGLKTAIKLSKMKNSQNWDITLLKGSLSASGSINQIPDSVKVIDVIPNLAEHLHEYDLVITHYGLTAYEAVFSGTQVLLDHPAALHRRLAKAAGFAEFTEKNFISNPRLHTQTSAELSSNSRRLRGSMLIHKSESLAELVNRINPMVNKNCPLCGEDIQGRSAARFYDRTYRRCKKCGIIYMDRSSPPPIEYEREYFFDSYTKQYGKTYLDDFEKIKETGRQRLKIIKSLLQKNNIDHKDTQRKTRDNLPSNDPYGQNNQSLLDIGCAYGPFLAAAREEGFSPSGIDPAEDAVCYIKEQLGIPAVQGFFPDLQPALLNHPYDVITLWFVIEHFTDCLCALKGIKKILKPGGILAFSTPSFSGISGKVNLRNFLSASPADHFTIWSPVMCKKALSLSGFKVKKIVVVGHHPERFPLLGKFAKNRKRFIYKMLLAISKLFSLGDTFEVYAQAAQA